MDSSFIGSGRSPFSTFQTADRPMPSVVGAPRQHAPFVTLAIQPGAAGAGIAQRLADALSRGRPPDHHWTVWDRELLELAAVEHQLPIERVEALETTVHSWFDDLLAGLGSWPDEMQILRGIQGVILRLAERGRVVLVGHGSAFTTRNMPHGIQLFLTAPLPDRIQNLAGQLNISPAQAADRIKQMYRLRRSLVRRYWPGVTVAPELFAACLNTSVLDEERLVNSIAAMVPAGEPAAVGR